MTRSGRNLIHTALVCLASSGKSECSFEPLVTVLPSDHCLAAPDAISLLDLVDETFLSVLVRAVKVSVPHVAEGIRERVASIWTVPER
jgi:hypothetical protein